MAANPRGVLRDTVPLPRLSTPLSVLVPPAAPLDPLKPLALLPATPPRPLRSSILPSWLLASSAIIHLLPQFSSD
jgi:hypothetical protein